MPSDSIPPSLASSLEVITNAQNQIVKSTPQLDAAVSNSNKNSLPPIAIGPSQGAYLSILCQLIKAKSILEIGALGGYSTIWFANSSPDVHVTSIEINPKRRDVALENAKDCKNVEILLGAALDVLPKLAEQGKVFDFIFIDADWGNQGAYFDWAIRLSRKGGCIYVDNAVRQLTEGEGSPASHALIEQVKGDRRVEATLIPTLNTHKKELMEVADGFVIAIVK